MESCRQVARGATKTTHEAPSRGALAALVESAVGGELIAVKVLGEDDGGDGTAKSGGYGRPLELDVRRRDGSRTSLVYHTAGVNSFGHDYRADRAAEMLVAYDTFGTIPDHVKPLDVGAVDGDGNLISLGEAGEFYLLTEFADGALYVDDLRRIASSGATAADRDRVVRLARWLAELHDVAFDDQPLYNRTLRDLVGSGEGIFGMADNVPPRTGGAPRARLQAIEAECNRWRWRLLDRPGRLRRIHGDFHPFNILFDAGGRLALLDASRGSIGDPANDVSCLAINFPFFALGHDGAWSGGLRELWYEFWRSYLEASGDLDILEVVAPFLAWRGLVLTSPLWYPDLEPADRHAMLSFVEKALEVPRFRPELVEDIFASPRA